MTQVSYYVGLDVHRKTIWYCMKTAAGEIVREGPIEARREALAAWAKTIEEPWCGGLEATLGSHWIYNELKGYAVALKMGQPGRLKAIGASKKKSDRLDAAMLADLLRANLFPDCYVLAPELEALRRLLRFRGLLVREMVLFKNKTSGLLIEHGIPYESAQLHHKRYFHELLTTDRHVGEQLRWMLRFNRSQIETLQGMDRQIVRLLKQHPALARRLDALRAIDGVGDITALTWALETGDPARFPNQKHAISYCGFCSAHRESAGHLRRGPLSKQRNSVLQSILIEAAHLAPHYNRTLHQVYQKARAARPNNEATIAVARKLVCYLLAADRQFFAPQPVAEP
jgi:transposase